MNTRQVALVVSLAVVLAPNMVHAQAQAVGAVGQAIARTAPAINNYAANYASNAPSGQAVVTVVKKTGKATLEWAMSEPLDQTSTPAYGLRDSRGKMVYYNSEGKKSKNRR